MAVVSKGYGVTDSVYVYYKNHLTLRFTPQTRTVKRVLVDSSGNNATVEFTDGESVVDVAADQRVWLVSAPNLILAANKIIDDVISDFDPCVVLGSPGTNSGASTAGAAAASLIRSNT